MVILPYVYVIGEAVVVLASVPVGVLESSEGIFTIFTIRFSLSM